jgi:hypothetical protein
MTHASIYISKIYIKFYYLKRKKNTNKVDNVNMI